MGNKFIPPLKSVGFLCFPYPSFDKENRGHGTYDLYLTASMLDEMKLNAWQRAELERVFAGYEDLTIVQKSILSKVLRIAK